MGQRAVVEARVLVQRVAVEAALDRASEVLTASGLAAVVLKGGWLLDDVYGEEDYRVTTDVDLLVRPADYERALAALEDAGWALCTASPRQAVLQHPTLPLPIDLHRALFPPATFSLPTGPVVQRARASRRPGILLPDPADGFCHLLGHLTNDRVQAHGKSRLQDFQHVAERYALRPESIAAALESAGMLRAAAYALPLVASHTGGDRSFAAAVLTQLSADPVGRAIARLCAAALPRLASRRRLGAALTCLLQPSLRAALKSARSRLRLDAALRDV